MQQFLSTSVHCQRIFLFCLMIFISLSGLFIFFEAAVTASKDKLSQEEKIEHEFREGTGLLEEDKQASDNKAETFQPDDKAKENPSASSEPGLVEKAQELIER